MAKINLQTASERAIQKTAESTGDSIGNKIANKITEVSKNSHQNNAETVANENDEVIPKVRYISFEERQKNYWWSKINLIV